MGDIALDKAILLDSEEDVAETFQIRCAECGTTLEMTDIQEEDEVGITIEIPPCENCREFAYRSGMLETDDNGRGF